MFFLRNIFPSKEVKVILAAVSVLLKEIEGEFLSDNSATLAEYHALKEIRSSVRPRLAAGCIGIIE